MPVIPITDAWTEADATRAAVSGWKLEPTRYKDRYNRDRIRWLITSIDVTKTDGDAINHVVMEAGKGYPVFLRAMLLHGVGADVQEIHIPTGLMP